jgi:DNA-binding beta-propeller fold protein YncE
MLGKIAAGNFFAIARQKPDDGKTREGSGCAGARRPAQLRREGVMEAIVGSGKYTYRVCEDWQRPPDWLEVKACAVSVDSEDRVYCFNRNDGHPIVVFDREGNFLSSWGAGLFKFPHAIRIVQENARDVVWLCDEHHNQFYKFTTDGQLLQTIGNKGERSDTGVPEADWSSQAWRKVTHGGGPFNLPTDICFAPDGSMFIADGYGNARIHKFSPDAQYRFSWGEPGAAPGRFNLPHGVWIDRRGRLLVADRENDRVQVFDQQGKFLEVWPVELIGPAFFYVDADDAVYIPEHNGGMISILTLDGERLARWGGPVHRSCHGIWCDSRGDLYVVQPGEWTPRARRVVKYERM